jgi:hypothetical protein
VVRLPSISIPLDNDSGSNAYSARLILQGEPLYGSHHPGHHLPGVYYTYAAVFAIFGDQPASLKIILIGWVWLNAWFIYLIGKQLSNRIAGILASVFFVLVSSMTLLNGDSAETELFANLPLTVACWLAIRAIRSNDKPLIYILIGAISGLAFLYKSVYLSSLAAIGATLMLKAALDRGWQNWLRFIKRSAWIMGGFLLCVGSAFGYFAAVGLWQRLMLVFQLGIGYVSLNDRPDVFQSLYIPLITLSITCAALAIVGLFSVVRTLITLPNTLSLSRQQGLLKFMVAIWVISSVAAAGLSGFEFSHYVLLLVPPFSLVAGIEIGDLWNQTYPAGIRSGFHLKYFLPVLMACVIIANSLYVSRNYFIGYIRYLFEQTSLTEFISQNAFLGEANLEAVEVAQYIDQHTSPDERILTWTELAQICYLANRSSTSDVLWPRYIPLLGSPGRVLELKPSYIVFYHYPVYSEEGQLTEWLLQQIKPDYILEAKIGNSQIYKRLQP